MRDIADNCLILRGITHPFASSLQKAVEEEFSPEPNGTLVKMPRQENGMKRTALAVLMLPAFAHADWSSPGFNAFSAEGTGVFTSQQRLRRVPAR